MPACLTTFYPQIKDIRFNDAPSQIPNPDTDLLESSGSPAQGTVPRPPSSPPRTEQRAVQ